jgi:hypothetical protein
MDARRFVNQYRKFRQIVRDEIGDLDEEIVISLFALYGKHLGTKSPQEKNPFNYYQKYMNSTNLDDFAKNFMDYFSYSGVDPDSEDNDDTPPNF